MCLSAYCSSDCFSCGAEVERTSLGLIGNEAGGIVCTVLRILGLEQGDIGIIGKRSCGSLAFAPNDILSINISLYVAVTVERTMFA